MKKQIWITWEKQRRSIELANAFGCELYIFDYNGSFRYFKSIIKTIITIYKEKPQKVFAQNPSIILAFLCASFLKNIFSFKLIVDRHSNFLLTKKKRNLLFEYLFQFLSYTSIKYTNLTIVTNEYLLHFIKILGGNAYILPDKVPTLTPTFNKKFEGKKKILFISSFAEDEPTLEIIDAIRHSKIKDLTAYITGNYSKLGNDTIQNIPENIILTGYLPDNDYIDLLFQVDIVIVLTKMDYTLLCGCYEAIAAEKPLITSNTNALKNYFKNAFFVENDPNSILNGISTVYNNMKYYENSTIKFKNHLIFEWNNNFHNLKKIISSI